MIVIQLIEENGKLSPERDLTPEEKASVIFTEVYNGAHHHYVHGEEEQKNAREQAIMLLNQALTGLASNNPFFVEVNQLIAEDPANALLNYVTEHHPDSLLAQMNEE